MKEETKFRITKIDPFLKTLPNTYVDSIQQRSKAGTPDYYLCINSHFVGLEVKTDKGVVSKIQNHTLDKIVFAGGIGLVVRPATWDYTKLLLTKMAEEKE